jgi:DNA repair protein RecO (recombination protein O)
MDWSADGYVLSVRKHGETSAIIEVFTRELGRHAGLVRGGIGRRMRPVLQPGNHVTVEWRGRLENQLGYFTVEARQPRSKFNGGALKPCRFKRSLRDDTRTTAGTRSLSRLI